MANSNHDIGNFNYGSEHPMKPKRVAMTHELVVSYGLYRQMNVYRPHYASINEMQLFHDVDYLKFLELSANKMNNYNSYGFQVSSEEKENILQNQKKKLSYKIGETTDCPIFPGLYDFCQISTGASWDAAILLAQGQCDVAINWSGGLHHAKKQEASGFCYVNDIVVAIIVLLQYYNRVLYIDIDVHHGDGVEEAFFTTNRVMTLSFHQYGDGFFPGSGGLESIGEGEGQNYSINIPLKLGINDQQYTSLFKDVFNDVMTYYRPDIIVLQCGADSIVNDRLGKFNLSTMAHAECVNLVLSKGLPTMLLGGGGYTIENVSRCWTNETAVALNKKLENALPSRDKYYESYKTGDYKLHIQSKSGFENQNTDEELLHIHQTINKYLKMIEPAPGIQFHDNVQINRDWQIDQENEQIKQEMQDEMEYVGKDITDNTGLISNLVSKQEKNML